MIVKDEFLGLGAPLAYRLATFTHDGRLIDKKFIGGSEYLSDNIMEATFKKNRTIHVDLLEAQYEKDPDDEGYYENPIVSTKNVGYLDFKVSSSGKIVKTGGSDNDTASE